MRLILTLFCCLWSQDLGAQNLPQLADSLFGKEAYQEATKLYGQLAQQRLEKGEYTAYLQWTVKQARSLQAVQADRRTISLLDSALHFAQDKVQEDTLIADIYHRMGVSYYRMEEVNFHPAIAAWQRALEIRRRFFPPNHTEIIRAHRNIGIAYSAMQNHQPAIQHLLNSLDLHLSRPDRDTLLLARTHRELGMIFSRIRDFDRAVLHTDVAYDLYKIVYREQPWEMGTIYESLVVLYKEMNDVEQMFFYCREAIRLYEGMEEKFAEDYWKLANFYSNLGIAYDRVDSLEAALDSYQRSMAINRRFPEEQKGKLAINWSNLSLVYLKLQRYDSALQSIHKAIELDEQLGDPLDLAANVNNLSSILWKMENYEEALLQQQRAIQYIVPDFEPQNIYQNPSVETDVIGAKPRLINYLNDKAVILRQWASLGEKKDRLSAAVQCYTLITQVVDQVRLTFESDDSKEFLQADVRDIFDAGIAVCYELYQLTKEGQYFEQALDLTERSKAMVLLEGLQEAQALLQAGVSDDLIRKEALVKNRMDSLQAQLYVESDADVQTRLRADLVAQRRALDRLLLDLQADAPEYYALKYELSTIAAAEITSLIGGATLIEYVVAKDAIYAFVIQTSDRKFLRIPLPDSLREQISQLRESIGVVQLSGSHSDSLKMGAATSICQAAFELYRALFAPIEQTMELSKELIIIPDDVLGYIPFEMLLRERPAIPTFFATHDYLIKYHQISYSYSISLLKKMLGRNYANNRSLFFGMAPSFNPSKYPGEMPPVYQDLSALSYNVAEVKYLHALLGGRMYTDLGARKEKFLEEASKYRIIHLATHGQANDRVGDYSFLAFTGTPDSIDNELLYNRELYNLHLQADMVVLSACETGIGELQHGEGIISLARGFTYAGAKSIITTLWNINDVKTEDLMQRFYQHLKKGMTKDVALHQAKLDFMEDYKHDAHPFYWAAIIPIGDMSSLALKGGILLWHWLVIGGVALSLLLIVIFRKRKASNRGWCLSIPRCN